MRRESAERLEVRDQSWALGIFLALAALYWHGHCRTFGAGDSPQHVLSALTLGVSRPPGYPLYVFIAHLFSRLPLGSPAGLVNAFSGLLQAGASAIFYLILRRWRCGRMAALAGTLMLSLAPLYWYYAEVAEVRALNDILAFLAAFLALSGPPALFGIILGLGVSHHPTYIFIFPAIAYLLWERKYKPRDCAVAALCAATACAAPYLTLYLRLCWGRAPVYNPDGVRTLTDTINLFLRKNTGGVTSFASGVPGLALQSFEPARALRESGWFGGLALHDLMLPGLALAALGCWNLWKTRREALIFWALWVLGTLLPVVLLSSQEVRFGDLDYLRAIVLRYYLLPTAGLFALAAFGADWLLSRSRKEFGWALVVVMIPGPVLYRPVDLSRSDPVRSYVEDILRSSGPRDMILLDSDEANFSMLYMDLVEGKTEDRVFLATPLFGNAAFVERLARRHPDLKLPREGSGLSRSLKRWMTLNPDRPMEAEPTMRDTLVQISSACFPQGILIRVGPRFPPLSESAAQARAFLDDSSAEKIPSWGLRPWTQEVYLLKAYAMSLEFYGSFVRRAGDDALAKRVRRAFDAVTSVR